MWGPPQLVLFAAAVAAASTAAQRVGQEKSLEAGLEHGEKKLSEVILATMEHYQQPEPVGLPGADVPDPYPVPDMTHSISFGTTLHFKNTLVYGISKFRILHINAEIGDMEVTAALLIDNLQAKGNYTLSTWLNRNNGPFTVHVRGLHITAKANLGVERDGKLRAQDITMDMSFSSMVANFENLGTFASMLQSVINSAGTLLFDSIKPFVLKEAYTKARNGINEKLEQVAGDVQFPNSVSPLDMVIADARKIVQDKGMDPYQVKDYNTTVSVFTVSLTNIWITGISSFHRVGNITLKMENNTAIADFEIGTQRMLGTLQWDFSAIRGLVKRSGTASFSVEYLNARIVLAQPLDVRNTPEFRELDLELGNIQVRCDGAGTLDYVIELSVNILPNLLRYQIMDASEGLIKGKVQQELNKINVEETIKEELPKVDEIQQQGFKLSSLKDIPSVTESFDEDDFFNF
ncbi:uncharacterized protein LOC133528057 [Cydia pomonella]|uniref:uncharacterized protein LOC133528057 n=1 Tax=Cydia pomonella TaxID=82600 RepID=UPI002ADD8E49|nr:uncharacterized protein LOC133528057 [Cydia pomonella]